MKLGAKHTFVSSCISYMVQAAVNNISPLLFVIFREQLGISLTEISALITVNFAIQIIMDFSSALFVDKIGYRRAVVGAEIFAATGLFLLGLLPTVMANKFVSLLIPTVISAIGGGLIEVIISPLVEALPGEKKSSTMCVMHSFYCWGQAGVILLSTLYFALFGRESWQYLPMIWALLPAFNGIAFCFVPIYSFSGETAEVGVRHTLVHLMKDKFFWLMMIIMICAGASELAMSQWASLFAEQGLGITKTVGDLLGPCAFALCMGLGRLLYGLFGARMRLERWIFASFALALVAYLMTSLSPIPALSLAGCALCGFSVAILWPGTYSLGAKRLAYGGTVMFSLFALGGDIGCTLGPDIVGTIADAVADGKFAHLASLISGDATVAGLKVGMLICTAVPLIAMVAVALLMFFMRRGDAGRGDKGRVASESDAMGGDAASAGN